MHQPVLKAEVIAALALQPDGVYVDGTFGRGGHSRAILERLGSRGRLIALDRDPEAAVTAPQIDDAARGFSFRRDGPLDMRMDPAEGISAAQWLASAEEQQIREVIRD